MNKIFGIGVDIVDINRFKNMDYKNNKKFYQKIFLDSEIEYCLKFKNSEQHFAGKFAAKEAVKKAVLSTKKINPPTGVDDILADLLGMTELC